MTPWALPLQKLTASLPGAAQLPDEVVSPLPLSRVPLDPPLEMTPPVPAMSG